MVITSANGTVSHNPVMFNIGGRIMIPMIIKTKARLKDIIAEIFPL
ncbi:hypothetical protein BN190_1870007 [Clostridioides difficile T14]|uniref:Uncharacterized protein n=1 Tax=Clostridioides difficile TaxID=1496 RepID=A0A069A8N4_CLODI|nr:hypothetical protein BN172_2190007 [Clostridioides difficile T15]CCL42191.1 hypothetical protein BN177_400007 [Clostridioides difficile E24]CCL46076.1 hypothetical protein BN178_640007 [Clostridioides difficile T42]CCL48713.1 hypothetical protein BN179_1420007 [Clostridioides difficile T6]CCL52648.1 hypothetical protein BN180_1220007 [Clostridioides difficile E14]CCL60386.1 hypothetical protein BN182_1440007 [Clostridioides difficile E9]CCL68273.1 hypothetical protein BN184_1290007 [Clostr